MKSKTLALFLILTILCTQAPVMVSAQTQTSQKPSTWILVKTIPTGDDVVINLKDGKIIKGMMYSANDVTLYVTHMGKTIDVDRKDIQRVYHVLPNSEEDKRLFSGIGALIGLFAGVFVAVGIGLDETHPATTARKVAATVAIPGGLLGGAMAGRALSKHQSKDLIYDAE